MSAYLGVLLLEVVDLSLYSVDLSLVDGCASQLKPIGNSDLFTVILTHHCVLATRHVHKLSTHVHTHRQGQREEKRGGTQKERREREGERERERDTEREGQREREREGRERDRETERERAREM